MKFLPTVNLWDNAISTALYNGQLRLQRGQWVQCGAGPKSRYVTTRSKHSVWVAHSEGSIGTKDSFKRLCIAAG